MCIDHFEIEWFLYGKVKSYWRMGRYSFLLITTPEEKSLLEKQIKKLFPQYKVLNNRANDRFLIYGGHEHILQNPHDQRMMKLMEY